MTLSIYLLQYYYLQYQLALFIFVDFVIRIYSIYFGTLVNCWTLKFFLTLLRTVLHTLPMFITVFSSQHFTSKQCYNTYYCS